MRTGRPGLAADNSASERQAPAKILDLDTYRKSPAEVARIADLLKLVPSGDIALDVGARDGHLSRLLSERFDEVVALDLNRPEIDVPRVRCVQGDVTGLAFDDNQFDLVLCAEVLEHLPPGTLATACSEITRVAREFVLVGVPYRQEIRSGRTTCYACGGKNPPWGHVNRFDERRLRTLFPGLRVERTSFVGDVVDSTNALSVLLLDLAGNPYGTYAQQESCVHCGTALVQPPRYSLPQKVCAKIAYVLRDLQRSLSRPHPNWIHVLFAK